MSKMKKHICMIAYTTYPGDPRVRREAETLAALQEYDVSFIVPREHNSPRRYVMDGVNVIELNMKRYQGKSKIRYLLSYLHFLVKSFFVSSKLFFKGRLDIAHVHNMPDFLVFAVIIPRLFGRKIILDIHDSMPETYGAKFGEKSNFLYRFFCWEEALSCSFVQRIICVNHMQRDLLIERGIPSEKIDISMNVPDHKRFSIEANNNGAMGAPKFRLVYHGTLAKRLGIDITIQAVAKMTDKIPDLEFHVIGDGDDAEEFIRLARKLGIEKNIHFGSTVPVDKVASLIKDMHVGVISNRKNIATEFMLPIKMLEYVSLNIPVVAPRLKTIQYYFSEDMVSYFEPENIDSMVDAILELYHDESRRKRQAQMARKFLDKYGWEKHQMDLINLYKSL